MRQLVTVACAVVTFGGVTFGQSSPNGAASDFGAKYASLMASAMDCKARTVGEPVSFNAPTGEKSGGQVLCDEAETSESRRGFRRSLGGLG